MLNIGGADISIEKRVSSGYASNVGGMVKVRVCRGRARIGYKKYEDAFQRRNKEENGDERYLM